MRPVAANALRFSQLLPDDFRHQVIGQSFDLSGAEDAGQLQSGGRRSLGYSVAEDLGKRAREPRRHFGAGASAPDRLHECGAIKQRGAQA